MKIKTLNQLNKIVGKGNSEFIQQITKDFKSGDEIYAFKSLQEVEKCEEVAELSFVEREEIKTQVSNSIVNISHMRRTQQQRRRLFEANNPGMFRIGTQH
jgi:hypothetical protein